MRRSEHIEEIEEAKKLIIDNDEERTKMMEIEFSRRRAKKEDRPVI